MKTKIIKINRAPVMTLWAKVVGERLGYKEDEALSRAKAVTGLTAQSKGRRLGIYDEPTEKEEAQPKAREPGEKAMVTVLGRPVPVGRTKAGLRAIIKGEEVDPESVQRYLELKSEAHSVYEKFRPKVP